MGWLCLVARVSRRIEIRPQGMATHRSQYCSLQGHNGRELGALHDFGWVLDVKKGEQRLIDSIDTGKDAWNDYKKPKLEPVKMTMMGKMEKKKKKRGKN